MPLPLLFIGVAAAAGAVGAGKSVKAGIDSSKANAINKSANQLVDESTARLNTQREACGNVVVYSVSFARILSVEGTIYFL